MEQKSVVFESLTERFEINSASGKQIFHSFAVLAGIELNLIREHTKTGLATARIRGHAGGQKSRLGRLSRFCGIATRASLSLAKTTASTTIYNH
ncbi:recombinase family protein [Cupriavidus basilensis]|uniref:Recombinase family protein n=1 Tax=Cupriavidus basilensis TaxID=68895 RepID=A0ABT6B5C3_9BURK|nr:recombinase family protein [Cupriavidus basilensis]MDF3840070.1 recombinase family protein [Cupriavidus basilensis]